MLRVSASDIFLFQNTILQWFKDNHRIFPWREPELSNYQIIISEILLQRTKAESVSRFYSSFIHDYPDWESLLNANLPDIEEYLKPLGLFKQRANRLYKLANYMVENKGQLPMERSELEKIPFMGQYIANAVELQIFDRRLPLLDVNMARLLERFFGPRKLADIRYDSYLQKLAFKIVNHSKSKEISWAILDFAALICKTRKPICSICPLKINCFYYRNDY